MNTNETPIGCGAECRCWRRCNYCCSSGSNWNGTGYATIICMNTEFPLCYSGDGFRCISHHENGTCFNKAAPGYDAEKVKRLMESWEEEPNI
jgi:hypothetical protein